MGKDPRIGEGLDLMLESLPLMRDLFVDKEKNKEKSDKLDSIMDRLKQIQRELMEENPDVKKAVEEFESNLSL